jgi:hypothetical protein
MQTVWYNDHKQLIKTIPVDEFAMIRIGWSIWDLVYVVAI